MKFFGWLILYALIFSVAIDMSEYLAAAVAGLAFSTAYWHKLEEKKDESQGI